MPTYTVVDDPDNPEPMQHPGITLVDHDGGPYNPATSIPSGTYVPAEFKRAVNLSMIPGWADNTYQNNSAPWNQDNLWTHTDGKQYAVWFNDTRKPMIGVRTLPLGRWTTFDLSTVAANPLGSPAASDGHNSIAVGVDSAGYIHVSGNHHGDTLRYVKSTNPNDITAWTAPGMVGTEETLVSYPRFFTHTDGTLFFHYRQGVSGNGDNYLNRWTGSAWVRVAKLIDGAATTESGYENRIAVVGGVIHYSFTWKASGGDYNSINDIGYMRSADKGVTWTTIAGAAVTLPVTHTTAPTVLDTAVSGSGIANQVGMDVDSSGYPHIATFFYDGTNRQINHFWWDGSAWHNDKVTDFALTVNDFTHWPSRPFIFCTADPGGIERTYIGYRYQYEGLRGKLRLIDVSGGATYLTADDFPILDLDLREWESTFDTQALRNRGELHLLVTPVNADVAAPRPEYFAADNWNAQWLGVLTIDLAQIGMMQRRAVQLPHIRTIGSVSVAEGTTTTAAALTTIAGVHSTVTPGEVRGRLVFVRLRARMSVTAGTGSVAVNEVQQGGSSRTFGTMTTTNTSTSMLTGAWTPLKFGPRNAVDSLLRIYGACSGGGTLTLSACTLEVGVLDGPLAPPA